MALRPILICMFCGTFLVSEAYADPFVRGDANVDGRLDISDAVFTLQYLFGGGEASMCLDTGDVDDNGALSLTDAVVLLNYLFRGGPPPSEPTGKCGEDPTPDDLACDKYDKCTTPSCDAPLPDEVGARVMVYGDVSVDFHPGGYMQPDGIRGVNSQDPANPQCGTSSIQFVFALDPETFRWTGVYFLLDDTWTPTRVFNMFEALDAKLGDPIKLRFWVQSDDDVTVEFKTGGVTSGPIKDSVVPAISDGWIKLPTKWEMQEIDLTGKDISSYVGALVWVCDLEHNENRVGPFQFKLDSIYFTKTVQ